MSSEFYYCPYDKTDETTVEQLSKGLARVIAYSDPESGIGKMVLDAYITSQSSARDLSHESSA